MSFVHMRPGFTRPLAQEDVAPWIAGKRTTDCAFVIPAKAGIQRRYYLAGNDAGPRLATGRRHGKILARESRFSAVDAKHAGQPSADARKNPRGTHIWSPKDRVGAAVGGGLSETQAARNLGAG